MRKRAHYHTITNGKPSEPNQPPLKIWKSGFEPKPLLDAFAVHAWRSRKELNDSLYQVLPNPSENPRTRQLQMYTELYKLSVANSDKIPNLYRGYQMMGDSNIRLFLENSVVCTKFKIEGFGGVGFAIGGLQTMELQKMLLMVTQEQYLAPKIILHIGTIDVCRSFAFSRVYYRLCAIVEILCDLDYVEEVILCTLPEAPLHESSVEGDIRDRLNEEILKGLVDYKKQEKLIVLDCREGFDYSCFEEETKGGGTDLLHFNEKGLGVLKRHIDRVINNTIFWYD